METARDVEIPAGPGVDLESLAASARDGDAAAFEDLVRSVGGRLLAFSHRVLGDRPLAEEAVQEAFVRIYRFLPRYRSKNFLAWSFTITHRSCLDLAKRERRSASLVALPGQDADPPSVRDHAEAVDVKTSVEAALATLPAHLRTTFLLVQQGLTYEDVAEILSIPMGTVRSRVHEARRLLRALLTPIPNGGT